MALKGSHGSQRMHEDSPYFRAGGDAPRLTASAQESVPDRYAGQRQLDHGVPDGDSQNPQGAPAPAPGRVLADILAWIKAGMVKMKNVGSFLTVGAAHPTKDLTADLADVISFRWSAKGDANSLRNSGMTYSDLMEVGMTHETMSLFQYTLFEWDALGFSKTDAEAVPSHFLGLLLPSLKLQHVILLRTALAMLKRKLFARFSTKIC